MFGQLQAATSGSHYRLNFDDGLQLQHLQFDSLANQNNLWQIGSPQKNIFTNAYNAPNVIVTDTVHPYPINDTSSFIIKNVYNNGFDYTHYIVLSGYYYVNTDSLLDYGTIEFSPDNGTTWIDLINNTTYASAINWFPKPVLSGNTQGLQRLYVQLTDLGTIFNIQPNDTVLYRFTFISDSIQTYKDGLMFDDIDFMDYFDKIESPQNDNLITIFPNPSSDILTLRIVNPTSQASIQIVDFLGKIVYNNLNFTGEIIDTKAFNNGIYFLKYVEKQGVCIKKLIVRH